MNSYDLNKYLGVNILGVPREDEYWKYPGIPSVERMRRGPVAVVECFQEIPCDVCEYLCPVGAIKVGHPITNLPVLDQNRCKGCKQCIAGCPGLAIFVVELREDVAKISLPYELLPVPSVGEMVELLDRLGNIVGVGKVIEVLYNERWDDTYVVTVMVPKELAFKVRAIKVKTG
ncbi:MAG: hypothetical protein QW168_05150 [Sulfolobales archaeon]